VVVPGATVREVIVELERRYPGIGMRLVEADRLRPNISVLVNGVASQKRLREPVAPDSEIHFVPTISGGMDG
jgi:sulfur-carrier protein